MIDASQDAAAPAAAPDPEPRLVAAIDPEVARAALDLEAAEHEAAVKAALEAETAAREAAAKAAHDEKMLELGATLSAVMTKLVDLRAELDASMTKAAGDRGHVAYTEAFLRDLGLKADEIVAWIKRNL